MILFGNSVEHRVGGIEGAAGYMGGFAAATVAFEHVLTAVAHGWQILTGFEGLPVF